MLTQAPASGLERCTDQKHMEAQLADLFHERAVVVGPTEDGKSLMMVYSTASGSTWTMVLAQAGGPSCVINTGKSLAIQLLGEVA